MTRPRIDDWLERIDQTIEANRRLSESIDALIKLTDRLTGYKEEHPVPDNAKRSL